MPKAKSTKAKKTTKSSKKAAVKAAPKVEQVVAPPAPFYLLCAKTGRLVCLFFLVTC